MNKPTTDEQGERIREAVKDYYANPLPFKLEHSFRDFEDMFEDRDPFEFL